MSEFFHDNRIEIERAFLSSLLTNQFPLDVAMFRVKSEDFFYKRGHQLIFSIIKQLYEGDKPVGNLTVSDALEKADFLGVVGGSEYLKDIIQSYPSSSEAEVYSYIDILGECWEKRFFGEELSKIIDGVRQNQTVKEALSCLENSMEEIRLRGEESFSLDNSLGRIDNRVTLYIETGNINHGVLTGFNCLDVLTGGMWPEEYILLAARPGMGKTAFALKIALNVCKAIMEDEARKDEVVLFFSLEMPKDQLANRLTSMVSGIDGQAIRSGAIKKADRENLFATTAMLRKIPLLVCDNVSMTPSEMKNIFKRISKNKKPILVIVDYVQLMRGDQKEYVNREQEVGDISIKVRDLARNLKVPILTLCQLNRKCEDRVDKRPSMSDVRNSGELEQNADTVLMLYRDAYYADKQGGEINEKHPIEVIIGKQRNGPQGVANGVIFNPSRTDYYEVDPAFNFQEEW